jgi:hypothetical protein
MESSRREFLQATFTAAAAACAWEPSVSISRTANEDSVLHRLGLGGNWRVSAVRKEDWFPAIVPGNIYTDSAIVDSSL